MSKFSDIKNVAIPSFSRSILIIATFIRKIVVSLSLLWTVGVIECRRNQAISGRVLPLNDGTSWSC